MNRLSDATLSIERKAILVVLLDWRMCRHIDPKARVQLLDALGDDADLTVGPHRSIHDLVDSTCYANKDWERNRQEWQAMAKRVRIAKARKEVDA